MYGGRRRVGLVYSFRVTGKKRRTNGSWNWSISSQIQSLWVVWDDIILVWLSIKATETYLGCSGVPKLQGSGMEPASLQDIWLGMQQDFYNYSTPPELSVMEKCRSQPCPVTPSISGPHWIFTPSRVNSSSRAFTEPSGGAPGASLSDPSHVLVFKGNISKHC